MRVFIYGTLKRGHRADHRLEGQIFVARAETAYRYRLVDAGGFPGLVAGNLRVRGELWDLTEDCLRELDDYEGVAEGNYERVPIELSDGSRVGAYLYLLPTATLPDCGEVWSLRREPVPPSTGE